MKNIIYITSLLLVSFNFIRCNKQCKSNENIISGAIKHDVAIYPKQHNLTSKMNNNYHITASHPFANEFLISHNEGLNKENINYNEYSILCYPLEVGCYAQIDKDVNIDDVSNIVTYTIKVKECKKCDTKRLIENYIAIRSIPNNYQVNYKIETN